jgi:hypothetical protein
MVERSWEGSRFRSIPPWYFSEIRNVPHVTGLVYARAPGFPASEGTEDVIMEFVKKKLRLREYDRLVPAAITFVFLCLTNYGMDIALDRYGMPASKTIVNDVIIGVLGAVAVFYYLSASRENYNFKSAKERIVLIGELNRRIRESLGVVTSSAMSEDREARLRGIDEAIDRIDDILCDFQVGAKAVNEKT